MNKSIITISVVIIGLMVLGMLTLKPETVPTFNGADLRQEKINAIVDTVKIGDTTKFIAYTDDNTGEDFIIKSDSKDYYGFGGNSILYFSVTNVSSNDQTANIVYSLGEKPIILDTKRFNRNETTLITIPAVPSATTTGEKERIETKETVIWDEISLGMPSVDGLTRKSIKDRVSKNGFTDTFKSGETKYYQATVNIPKGVNNDEFFIEAFGSKSAYGSLDPNLWTYEQKFNTLNDGDLNGQDGWTGSTLFDVTATAASPADSYPDPTAVKHIQATPSDGNDYLISKHLDTDVASGIFYYSIKRSSQTSTDRYLQYFYDASDNPAFLTWMDWSDATYAGKIVLYVNGNFYVLVSNYTINTWYRIGVDFNCTTKVLKINVNGGSWTDYSADFAANPTITSLHRITLLVRVSGITSYFDFISPDYAPPAAPPTQEDIILFE